MLVLILMGFVDITEAMELMFSRITEHLPTALVGIIIQQKETIILTRDKRDILARIVLIITDRTAGISSIKNPKLLNKTI